MSSKTKPQTQRPSIILGLFYLKSISYLNLSKFPLNLLQKVIFNEKIFITNLTKTACLSWQIILLLFYLMY